MQQKQINLRLLLIAAPVVFAMIVLSRVQQLPQRVESPLHAIMGTVARIIVMAPDTQTGQRAIQAGFEAMERVDGLMSTYRPDSELTIVNEEAHERPVPVSGETWAVLQKAGDIHRASAGAFDVTVGPLLDLWQDAADSNAPPTPEQIAAARARVGWERVKLDTQARTVTFTQSGMRIDLGGIAKGYAIDQAVEALRKAGAVGAMVDIGGDIRCFGTPPRGNDNWRIGLQDPRLDESGQAQAILMVLSIDDRAVATSGHYRRFALIDGQRVSHIVEPESGRGSGKLASTTILAPDALTADALATAVSVMGQDQGLALVESLDDVEAIVIPPELGSLEMIQTRGAGRFIQSETQ
jgi:thiamine biosynthesis lipoprotein